MFGVKQLDYVGLSYGSPINSNFKQALPYATSYNAENNP